MYKCAPWCDASLSNGYVFMAWYLIKQREDFTISKQIHDSVYVKLKW